MSTSVISLDKHADRLIKSINILKEKLKIIVKKRHESMIAVCGLDCGTCGIFLASYNPQITERLAKNFREQGIMPDATPNMFRCDGCRGDRARHWSPNCWMLKCCIDDKSLKYCNQCTDFPCTQLEKWATKNDKHKEALIRLKSI